MTEFLYGRWAVLESLRAGRRKFQQVLIADTVEEKSIVNEIISTAETLGVGVRHVPRHIIDDLGKDVNHQGVVLRASPYPYSDIDAILQVAKQRNERPFLLLLDLLKDPQNVGVLSRVANAVGIHGIVFQSKRSVAITPAVVSSSSGAIEHIHVAEVNNLVNAMKRLKEEDVWLVGLEIGPNIQPINRIDLNMSLGLVLGSEGEGIRRLVRDTCDILMTLPMRGDVESLNVATVGSIAMYSAWQARGWEGWVHASQKNNPHESS
jgi:23S rRNA (guanosine2251-2'-O)-methyltransferase